MDAAMASLPSAPSNLEWLVDAAIQQGHFRQVVRHHVQLLDLQVLMQAIVRYEQLWLPLVNRLQKEGSAVDAAPLDVAWVWHCHMLDPSFYLEYCQDRFERLVAHYKDIPSVAEYSEMESCWKKEYPSQPFETVAVSTEDPSATRSSNAYIQLKPAMPSSTVTKPSEPTSLAKELMKAIPRHAAFLYQLCRPYFQSRSFLRFALQRYHAVMQLKKEDPDSRMAIACDVSVILYAHQCVPQLYEQDMSQTLNRPLLTLRSSQTARRETHLEMAERWTAKYDSSYFAPGTAFRGDSPPVYLSVPHLGVSLSSYGTGAIEHQVKEVIVHLQDRNRRHLQVKLTHGAQSTTVTLSRDSQAYLTWRGTCNFTCSVQTDFEAKEALLEVEVSREHHLRRGSVVLSKAEHVLETTGVCSWNAPPIVIGFQDGQLELQRTIEFRPANWDFSFIPQPFTPIEVSQVGRPFGPLTVQGQMTPSIIIPRHVAAPASKTPAEGRLCMAIAVHPIAVMKETPSGPALWCAVIHVGDLENRCTLTLVQLVDCAGAVLGVVRTSLPNEWPTKEFATAWGVPDLALEDHERSVVIAFEGKDWAIVRGSSNGDSSDRRKGLTLEFTPLPVLLEVLGSKARGLHFILNKADAMSLVDKDGNPYFTVHLSSGRITMSRQDDDRIVLLWLLVSFGAVTLSNLCCSTAMASSGSVMAADDTNNDRRSAPVEDAFGTIPMYMAAISGGEDNVPESSADREDQRA